MLPHHNQYFFNSWIFEIPIKLLILLLFSYLIRITYTYTRLAVSTDLKILTAEFPVNALNGFRYKEIGIQRQNFIWMIIEFT